MERENVISIRLPPKLKMEVVCWAAQLFSIKGKMLNPLHLTTFKKSNKERTDTPTENKMSK